MHIATFRQGINEALHQEMDRDDRVIVLGEDVAGGAGVPGFEELDAWGGPLAVTRGLVVKFGRNRVLDTPLSETGFIGAATGAAMTGLRPVVELTFIDFMGVCLDQIVNQAAKSRYMFGGQVRVPMVIRTMIGAGDRMAGQHSGSAYSVFAHFPGLKTVVPSTPADAKGLMAAAVRDDNPVVFCEHRGLYNTKGEIQDGEHVVELGVADVKRQGTDITVVAIGKMVLVALDAARVLAQQGIDAEIIDPRTLWPLDAETILESVRKTGHLLVVDEDTPVCSVGSEIIALVARRAFASLRHAPQLLTVPHTPAPFSAALEDAYLPRPQSVVEAASAVLKESTAVVGSLK